MWMGRLRQVSAAALAFARSEAVMLAGLAVIAGGMLAFVEIADDMTESDGRAVDLLVLRYLHPDPANPGDPVGPLWLDHAMSDFTALGSVTILVSVVLLAGGFLLLRRRGLEALLLVLGLGGGLVLSQSLKGLFMRERPPDAYRAVEVLNESFPSGHAMLSAVVYLTLGAMLARATPSKRIRAYVIGAAILLTVLVGVSRAYLGAHWASDVLAGWSVGAAWATACWLLDRWLRRRGSRSQSA
jgi:undecaprenyl-diphosphatase